MNLHIIVSFALYLNYLIFRFWDIPSPWWQASTVLVGTGTAISMVVAVTAVAACCITYVIHTLTAKVAGACQLLAGIKVLLNFITSLISSYLWSQTPTKSNVRNLYIKKLKRVNCIYIIRLSQYFCTLPFSKSGVKLYKNRKRAYRVSN